MSKELLAGSRSSFSFLSIPNSQIFAFPCSMSLYKQGGGGVENGLSSPSPSVPCITVELFKRKDVITEEIKNSCAGPALLLSRVPRYFSAPFSVHPALAVSQEIPLGCCGVLEHRRRAHSKPAAGRSRFWHCKADEGWRPHCPKLFWAHVPFYSWIFHNGS